MDRPTPKSSATSAVLYSPLATLLPIALAIYLATTVLSIYKPWGTTRRGKVTRSAIRPNTIEEPSAARP